jgi:sugar lactone lactonase YvrE
MKGFRRKLIAFGAALLVITSACGQPATVAPPTSVPPTAVPPTALPPTAAPPSAAPTTAPIATLAPSSTPAATAIPSTATPDLGVAATSFALAFPWGVAADSGGSLYISTCPDGYLPRIYVVDSAGLLKTYAGSGWGFGGDGGPALEAKFFCPGGLAVGPDGSLYVADQANNRIRRIDHAGMISTVAGSGPGGDFFDPHGDFAGDGGPAVAASLSQPTDVAFDSQGNLYIADRGNHRVRKVDTAGIITTFAGTGEGGFSGDGGPATDAQLNAETPLKMSFPPETGMSLAVDAAGNVYIGDGRNARIRKVDAAGIITTFAGTGKSGYSGDGGPAESAQLSYPSGLAVDAEGSLYFSDGPAYNFVSHRIRKIDPAGIITTFAGGETSGFSGDGGAAAAAAIHNPVSLALDAHGNLYFADNGNARVRKIATDGIITTVAGGGF